MSPKTQVWKSKRPEARDRSIVSRGARADGKLVHIKHYVVKPGVRDERQVRRIVSREFDLACRLEKAPGFRAFVAPMRLVECDLDSATLTYEHVAGQSFEDLLVNRRTAADRNLEAGLRAAGRWLRCLQQVPLTPEDGCYIDADDPPEFEQYCEIRFERIQRVWPRLCTLKLRERYREAFEFLRPMMGDAPPLRWTHGDYGPFNVIWDGSILTAVDYERVQPGSPYLDLAYFALRLEMLSLEVPWKSWPVEQWKRYFFEGYGGPVVELAPEYRACRLRHLLCRLGSVVLRPGVRIHHRLHARYLRYRIIRLMEQSLAEIVAMKPANG